MNKYIIKNEFLKKFLEKILLISFLLFFLSDFLHLNSFLELFISFLFFLNAFILLIYNRKINKYYSIWFLCFYIFCFISLFWAIDIAFSIPILLRLLKILVFTFSICLYVKGTKEVNNIILIYYLSNAIVLIYLILFYDFSNLNNDRISVEDFGEAWNINIISMNFIYAIILGAYYLSYKKSLTLTLINILFSSGMIIIIILSGSKKAFGMLLLLALSYFLFFTKKKFIYKILSVSLFLFIIYLSLTNIDIFYYSIGIRIEDIFQLNDGGGNHSDITRYMLIVKGIEWFKENPIIGVGINNFRVLSNSDPYFSGGDYYSHNNYIELLVNTGILGFLIYYIAYIYLLFNSIKKYNYLNGKIIILIFCLILFSEIGAVLYYDLNTHFLICISFILISLKRNLNKYEDC